MTIKPNRALTDFHVSSETRRGVVYYATRYSCSCPGFARYGKPGWTCKHVRAVRETYGAPLIRFPQPAQQPADPKEAA